MLPEKFRKYYQQVRRLKFHEIPDYITLRDLVDEELPEDQENTDFFQVHLNGVHQSVSCFLEPDRFQFRPINKKVGSLIIRNPVRLSLKREMSSEKFLDCDENCSAQQVNVIKNINENNLKAVTLKSSH